MAGSFVHSGSAVSFRNDVEITPDEFSLVWPIFQAVVAGGDVFAYPPETTFDEARQTWTAPPTRAFVGERDGTVLGELRVSKALIESLEPGDSVTAFRPGHLAEPRALPQALAATGFRYSSSTTAGASIGTRYVAPLSVLERPRPVLRPGPPRRIR